MDRYRPHLLLAAILMATSGLTAACAPEMPVEFVLDSHFSEREVELILQGSEDWNQAAAEYLGYRPLVYKGRFTDPKPFDIYRTLNRDPDSGPRPIYRLDDGYELDLLHDILGIDPENGGGVLGNNTDTAIILWPSACAHDDSDLQEACLRLTAAHEMGHAIGLAHLPKGQAGLMAPYLNLNDLPSIGRNDLKVLCIVHPCLKKP